MKLDAFNTYSVSVSNDNTVKKINRNGYEEWSFNLPSGSGKSVAIDSKEYIYVGSSGSKIRKITPDGNEITTGGWPYGEQYQINCIAIDNKDNIYFGTYKKLKKIDTDGNELWLHEESGNTYFNSIVIDTDGYLYTAFSNEVKKIDPSGNKVTSGGWPFTGHTGVINELSIDSAGYIYTASEDNTVKKIDPSGNEVTSGGWPFVRHQYSIYDPSRIHSVSVDNTTGYVYSSGNKGDVKKIDINGYELNGNLNNYYDIVRKVVAKNTNIHNGKQDGKLIKIDSNTGMEMWKFTGHSNVINDIAVFVKY